MLTRECYTEIGLEDGTCFVEVRKDGVKKMLLECKQKVVKRSKWLIFILRPPSNSFKLKQTNIIIKINNYFILNNIHIYN